MFHSTVYIHKYSQWENVFAFVLVITSGQGGYQWCVKEQKTMQEEEQGCLCACIRDNERETGREEDSNGGGLSNTLLIKVKEMFYS